MRPQKKPTETADSDASYRALFRVPSVAPLLAGMQIARIAQSMVGVRPAAAGKLT